MRRIAFSGRQKAESVSLGGPLPLELEVNEGPIAVAGNGASHKLDLADETAD